MLHHIKGNEACNSSSSNMVTNILPIDPLPGPLVRGQKVIIQLFQNMVISDIKLKGIMNAATYKCIFCPYTPPTPGVGSKVKTFFYSEGSHVAYQIN